MQYAISQRKHQFFFFFESVAILQLSDLILILLVHDLRETNCKLTSIVREVTLPFLLPSSLDGKLKSWTWNPFFHLPSSCTRLENFSGSI